MDQAPEADGSAPGGPLAVEAPSGGGDFLDGATRGDRQHVLAGRFLFADGGFGEQVVRARLHGGAVLAFLDFGAAGSGLLSGSSHKIRPITVYRPYAHRFGQPLATELIINGEIQTWRSERGSTKERFGPEMAGRDGRLKAEWTTWPGVRRRYVSGRGFRQTVGRRGCSGAGTRRCVPTDTVAPMEEAEPDCSDQIAVRREVFPAAEQRNVAIARRGSNPTC